jgi:hypothetical protein
MIRGLDDRYNSFNRANHLQNGEEEIQMKGSRFLPSLELINWFSAPAIDKILTPNGIDMAELLTYIEPTIVIGVRNRSFTDAPDYMRRIIYPMRICHIKDFTDIGYESSHNFDKSVRNRLCPHVPVDEHFRVKNLYQNKEE